MSKLSKLNKRITALLITGALAITSVMSGCSSANNETSKTEITSSSSNEISSENSQTTDLGGNIAMKSEHYQIPVPIASFLFNSYYNNRRDYAAYQGLDVTKSLKEQYYNEEQGITWFDAFMYETKNYLAQVLVLCEAATAEGVKLDDEDEETVKMTLDSIRNAAETSEKSYEEYIAENFGEGLTENDIKEYLELTALYSKYYNMLYDGYKFTDEEYEKCFEENKTSYQYADFMRYNFSFSTGTETSQDSKAEAEAKEKAKAYAEDLAKCTSGKDFKAYVKNYLTANPQVITAASESQMTEDEIKAAIDSAVDNTYYKKYAYEVTSVAGKWIFDIARNPLDTTVIENTNSYTSLLLIKPAYRDESVGRDVRHILFTPKSYGGENESDEKTLEQANSVYEKWKAGEKTEESFAELAKEFSDDTGSKENGGLYKDVKEGEMVEEFNNWLFDDQRKSGDNGIVHTKFGYHIMYYVGDNEPEWKLSMDTLLRKASFEETYKELSEKYEIEYDEAAINSIEESEPEESSAITYEESSEEPSAESSAAAESSAVSEASGQASQTSQTSQVSQASQASQTSQTSQASKTN